MQRGQKIVLVCAVLAIAAMVVEIASQPRRPKLVRSEGESPASSQSIPPRHIVRVERTAPASAGTEDRAAAGYSPLHIPREKVEAYVELHHRQAASLLAAFHALNDTNFLYEAATNFPNDPRVQRAVLAYDLFPDSRQQWLDAFKASSPSNSLPNYLAARDDFKNGRADAALKELADATGKPGFEDYSMDTLLDAQDLSRFNGNSAAEGSLFAMSQFSGNLLPELANFKGIATGIRDAQKQYAEAGDASSIETLAQFGVQTADRLMSGDDGKLLISQLVGIASETIVLQALDPNTSYAFLGGQTPAQRLAELQQQKSAIRSIASGVHPMPDDFGEYMDRVTVYGEFGAMQWYQQQHSAVKPSTGN